MFNIILLYLFNIEDFEHCLVVRNLLREGCKKYQKVNWGPLGVGGGPRHKVARSTLLLWGGQGKVDNRT